MALDSRTPVTIVMGFLGSGKTSLLNHVLSQQGAGRVAALVNDFGTINIDAATIAGVGEDVVQLANGCVCCTINGDLCGAARRVLARSPSVDRIVVETTGLADPLPVCLTLLRKDLRRDTILDGVVTVVDCDAFAFASSRADAALAQIRHADIVGLNKTDLAGPDRVRSLRQRIAVIKPRARMIEASFGRVPMAAIMPSNTGGQRSAFVCEPADASRGHLLNDGFASHRFRFDRRFSSVRFQTSLDQGLPAEVFRAKGDIGFTMSQNPQTLRHPNLSGLDG